MANNKIVYGNTTLVDLTGDTAVANKVAQGTIFLDASGTQRTGTMTLGGASVSGTHLSIPGKTYTPPSWSTGKAEDIATALEYHYRGYLNLYDFWNIGDERTVSLSAMSGLDAQETHVAQDVVFVLTNIGGKYLSDGTTECVYQVDQKNCLIKTGVMNTTGTNVGGWKESNRRTWLNSTYKNAIPEDLRSIFKEFINKSGKGNTASELDSTNDYFAFRAEVEMVGSTNYSANNEGTQISYYTDSSHRVKYVDAYTDTYWLRSPRKDNAIDFGRVARNGTIGNPYLASTKIGIAPFGVI